MDAATGGRAIFGRAIEKKVLGVPQGAFEFINFDSVDITRLDEENPSAAITGNEGSDRGTPGPIKFDDKVKYSMTASRILFDLVAMFGKPNNVSAIAGGDLEAANAVVTAAGTGYMTGDVVVVTDAGGGSGAIVHVIAAGGLVTGFTVVDPGAGYVTPLLDLTGSGDGLATATITPTTKAWLVKIRPSRLNEIRGASLYLFEGGSYSATMQTGRRAADISVVDAGNKRAEVTVTYSDPTGDTISGFLIGKSTNVDATYQALAVGTKLFTRGRRPYDSHFDADESMYLNVTAVNVTPGSESVTFKAAYAAASGLVDGTNFGSPSFDTATFTVPLATASFDGYQAVTMDAGTVGLFGENFEAFEVSVGAVAENLANLTVDDVFEIPVAMPALTKTVNPETRLSMFHLIRKLGGTDVRIDSGTTKIDRPYKAYIANGRRIPQAIDPMGDSGATFTFKKRLFDRFFRKISDAHTRFSIQDVYRNEAPIAGTTAHEAVEIYAPQCAVTALKSGDVSTKNVLEESVTLHAEQPDTVPSSPAGFDDSALYPIQINITTLVNPTWLA